MLALRCPTVFMYGFHDWMDEKCGRKVGGLLRAKGVTAIHCVVSDAGHQIFLENNDGFVAAVLGGCELLPFRAAHDPLLSVSGLSAAKFVKSSGADADGDGNANGAAAAAAAAR